MTNSISISIQLGPHRLSQMQIFPIYHGPQRRIAHTQFAGNAEISVTSQGLCHSSSIQLKVASLTWPNHVFQQLFVLLQQPTAAMIAQNAKENVLVVCEMRHTLDNIDVRMLRPLAGCVFRPPPHYNLAHFVQNAVCLFKVPALSPANSVSQMCLEQLKQRHALPVQACRSLTDTFHSRLIIFHSRAATSTSAISLLGSTTGIEKG